MSLNVILGKSNTGKSEYMFRQIMACENSNKQAILFVPPSGRIIAEEEYMKYTNKTTLIDTKITSIERFVSRSIDKNELYEDKDFLPELAKKILIRKVISENPDMFKIFSRVKDTSGFTDKIADYMLKLKDIDTEDVINKYDTEDFLKLKLDEFVQVYNKLKDSLSERFVTAIDEMLFYITLLNKSKENIVNARIFIDNYNNFNNTEYLFIQALLLNGNDVTITLDIDKEKYLDSITTIYNTSYDTLAKLKELCVDNKIEFNIKELKDNKNNSSEDIVYLANNLFDLTRNVYKEKSENVSLILRSNTYEEIKYVAEDILEKINCGYSFKDIAVYTNNVETYYIYLKKIFDTYNIPMYINEDTSLSNSKLVVCLTSLLELVVTGFQKSTEKVLNILKTGLINISQDDVNIFENYMLEFGIKGYSLKNEFVLNSNYDLDLLNGIRYQIIELVENLRNKIINLKTSKDITQALCDYLNETDIIRNYEQQLQIVKNIDVNEFNKKKQVLGKIYEVMDSIVIAYDKISIKDYYDLLEYGIYDAKIDTIPEKLNQIEIVDINRSRGTEKKVGYLIGCYDGGLPSIQSEDNIFTDVELEKLKSFGIDLKQTSEERNNMQLFNIYQVLNKVREKLIITVPSSSSTGVALRPSAMIQDIKTILNISLQNGEKDKSYNTNEDFMKFVTDVTNISEDISEQEIQKLYNKYLAYKDNSKFQNILDYSRRDSNLQTDTLNKVYKEKINSSVSRLEQYKRCPFAYYTQYLLNIKDKKEYVMSSLDTGSLMHEIIEKFSKFIVAKNINWQEIILDEKINKIAIDKINEIVDKIFEEEYSKYLTSARYVVLKTKMKKAMQKTILAIADSFNHSEFRPLGYEIEFEKDSLFAPIEVELDNGKILLLRGKIDRIDSLKVQDNTYLRIVDYKSSDKNLKLSDVKSGISLQLMTYMCAMIDNKDKVDKEGQVIPAAVSYFTISNKLLNIPSYEQDENKITEKVKKTLKLRGIYIKDMEILNKLDNNIEDSKNSYLEVSKRTINNRDKVLDEEIFIQECKNVKKILKEIGKEITNGNVKIQPNKDIKNTCEYCSYSTICRKNILN